MNVGAPLKDSPLKDSSSRAFGALSRSAVFPFAFPFPGPRNSATGGFFFSFLSASSRTKNEWLEAYLWVV